MADAAPEAAAAEANEGIEKPEHASSEGVDAPSQEGQESIQEGQEAIPEGQEPIQEGQESIQEGQEAIPEGQEAIPEGQEPIQEGQEPMKEGEDSIQEGEAYIDEEQAYTVEGQASTDGGQAYIQEGTTGPEVEETDMGEETEEEITEEMHEENIMVMREVLHSFLDMAAEGKLPEKEEKPEFEMKEKKDSTADLLEPELDLEDEVKEDETVSPEGSLEEKEEEEEEAESASMQEAWAKRQQQLEEFDAVHDEAQRLRIMNMLLQSRVLRAMQRRPKTRGISGSTASTGSSASAGGSRQAASMAPGDLAAVAESLEKELLEAGEVRKQLEAEMHRGVAEDNLRKRLATARSQVAETAAHLEHLQEKMLARMRASPARRQVEQMLKRVWPQLLRLRRERLLHLRAKHELDDAQKQVAELEAFGPDRTVTAYEELLADGVKLAEHAQERGEQLAALRTTAEQNVQQAAHFREELQGTRLANMEARRLDVRASSFLKKAREEVLRTKRKRDYLYKENNRLKREMELLANPELLRDHEEVLRRLRVAQADLEKLRMMYVNQEKRIAAARRLLENRETILREGVEDTHKHSYLVWHMDAKCGPSRLMVNDDS